MVCISSITVHISIFSYNRCHGVGLNVGFGKPEMFSLTYRSVGRHGGGGTNLNEIPMKRPKLEAVNLVSGENYMVQRICQASVVQSHLRTQIAHVPH